VFYKKLIQSHANSRQSAFFFEFNESNKRRTKKRLRTK